jgi:hypothetical protein
VGAGCESEDEGARHGVAEAGHRPSPIGLVTIGAAALEGHFGTIGTQAGAALAGHDALVKRVECGPGALVERVKRGPGALVECFESGLCSKLRRHGSRRRDLKIF